MSSPSNCSTTTTRRRLKPPSAPPPASPYLLQPDPAACIQVELVERPVVLPTQQFDALLVDSECEV